MFLLDWFHGVLSSFGLWQKEAKILFLGHDNAAKSFVLYMLKNEHLLQEDLVRWLMANRPPRHPILSEEFSIGQVKFKAFDLGGHQIARRVWNDYYSKVDAVVYLLDRDSFEESRNELDALLSDESLATVPFLILGQMFQLYEFESERAFSYELYTGTIKYDFKNLGGRPYKEVAEEKLCYTMGLQGSITGKGKVNLENSSVRPLEVFMCSYLRRRGYYDGFKWLSQYIK